MAAIVVLTPVYRWLVANGLWTGTVFAATGVITTGALTWSWAKVTGIHPLKLLWDHIHANRALAESNARIADALDTSKPGGLTDLVQAIKKEE